MFDKLLREITADDIRAYVKTEPLEDEALEFKQALDDDESKWASDSRLTSQAKQDVLRALIALANTRGGHLMLGISEADSDGPRASGITPIPNCERLAENLRRVAESVVEPRIPSLEVVAVPTDDSAGVIVFRVGRSLSAPHRLNMSEGKHRLHAFWRRGWETLPMSMRDIQDLTLRIDRGEVGRQERLRARVERVDHELGFVFGGTLGVIEIRTQHAFAFTVLATPLEPILIENVFRRKNVHPRSKRFLAEFSNGSSVELHSGSQSYAPPRPIIRGVDFVQPRQPGEREVHSNRLVESGDFDFIRGGTAFARDGRDDAKVYPGWFLSDLAHALYLIQRIRSDLGLQNIDFGLRAELLVGDKIALATFSDHPFRDIGKLDCGRHLFPEYHVRSVESFPDIISTFADDLCHLAGQDYNDRVIVSADQFTGSMVG